MRLGWVVGWLGGNFSRREAREPCHAPQISYPIPARRSISPHLCASSPHRQFVCANAREIAKCVDHPSTSSVSHTFPCSRRRCLPLTAMTGESILVAATRCRHIIIATTRSACGGQVLSHSNRLSTFNSPVVVPPPSCPPLAPSWRMMGA